MAYPFRLPGFICKSLERPFLQVAFAVFPEILVSRKPKWNPTYTKGAPLCYFQKLTPRQISFLYNGKGSDDEESGRTSPKENLEKALGESKLKSLNFELCWLWFSDVTKDGKVKKLVTHQGNQKPLSQGQIVTIHFSAYTFDKDRNLNPKPFLSTYHCEPLFKHKESKGKGKGVAFPARLHLGDEGHVPYLNIGVSTMEVGEKAEFIANAQYAYGPCGLIDSVPPNSTIFFKVHVLAAEDPPRALLHKKKSKRVPSYLLT